VQEYIQRVVMKTMAELIDHLFQTHRREDGREYTYSEVSRLTDGKLDPSYLSKMRRGEIENPTKQSLLHLCRFFQVPPSYFFPELATFDQHSPEVEDPLQAALRARGFPEEVREKIDELLRLIEPKRK
jgi:transcriptional regulator with XRE-family HTH domain